jgi:primosomal protein N' (replication factor Y) (superfamily II helicase)
MSSEGFLFELPSTAATSAVLADAVAMEPAGTGKVARVKLEEAGLELDYSIPPQFLDRVKLGSRVMVPLQRQRVAAVVIELLGSNENKFRLKDILDVVGRDPSFTPVLLKMAQWVAEYYVCPVNQVLRTMLPQAVRAKPESFLTDSLIKLVKPLAEPEMEKLRKKAPLQVRLLELLETNKGEATLSQLRKELPQATAVLKSLLKSGVVERSELRLERDPYSDEVFLPTQPLSLTEEQVPCLEATISAIEKPLESKPMLLHGITGSGKTEIFLQAIAHVIEKGMTALVLVPEISLTPQTIERFKARFSERRQRIAVLHSMLSDGERHDEWFKVHERKADIVIGARSAIFAPLERLGIIIVDEEHEPSYKQDENPRYHARDIAVLRAKLEGCAVLLASATPSLESYNNATAGKYELLRMTRRTDGKQLPLVRVVDMRLQRRKGSDSPDTRILSEQLRSAVLKRLEKNEQIILFLNRRGFNTTLSCMACGSVCKCQDCDVPMTLHKTDERLVCHICGARRVVPRKCPACSDPGISFGGYGTERVEGILRLAFPTARLARVDTDSMQKKNDLRDTLRDFRAHKLDMLIGTQMIAKGLDFPNVTLVGVLNADLALNMPDFRAAERTFQLLTQVSGRAGRGEVLGEVIVQTFAPHSPAVQFSRKADFDGYAQQELEQRVAFRYPPYTHCVLITARGKNAQLAEFTLQTLATRLREGLPEECIIGEPVTSPLSKSHGQYRFQLLMRSPKIRPLARHVGSVVRALKLPPDVIVTWDVDAMQLM